MPARPIVLRNKPLYWSNWFAALASIALFVAGVAAPPGEQTLGDQLAFGLVTLGAAAVFVRVTRMRLELTDPGVTVYKLLSTETVPWEDIADVTTDRSGLHIRTAGGSVVTAGTMGTSRWAAWFKTDANGEWVRRIQAGAESSRKRP
jgi:hypothetical protein